MRRSQPASAPSGVERHAPFRPIPLHAGGDRVDGRRTPSRPGPAPVGGRRALGAVVRGVEPMADGGRR